jgi:pimeloyl-ACP methyl ester carboxylesterase/2-polyprenyl-6-methoxyphenol hydroxylase-like FAD-dependent oxidoreductase
MAEILVLGAGLNGLATAMLLARDGHRVTVLERDPAEPSGAAEELWATWERRGVNQFHQLHFMMPRWRALIERELPAVLDELLVRGGARVNLVGRLPDAMTGGPRETDRQFETVTARRPVLEAAVAAAAARIPGLTVRRGVAVTGLLTGREPIAGVPHVTGVLTGGGSAIRADLVVDAMGRRSPLTGMLDAVGGRKPVEEREDSGFVYYCRHYRSVDGQEPAAQAMLLQHFESVSVLTLPADSGTWGVGFTTSSQDKQLRALRDPRAWEAALALFPTAAHWAAGEPITGIQVIAGIEDRYRRFVVEGQPVATGLVAVGDSWACTNPSLGRGASIGMLHACALRDLLREVGPDEPEKLVRRFDEVTESTVAPLYRMTLGFDRHRLAEIAGDIAGEPYRTPDASWALSKALYAAAPRDHDVLRAYASIVSLNATPKEALAEPGLLGKVIALGANAPRYGTSDPSRAELLAAIDGGGAAHTPRPPTRRPAPAGQRASSPGSGTEATVRVDLDGIGINVADTGSGPAVLLLHGWPDDHRLWRHQVAALTAAGYRTIAPDLRGFGDSDKPGGTEHYGMIQLVGDLVGLLDHLGVPRAHVVGHDWGGAIGSVLASMVPDRVASLTCLSVGHPAAYGQAGWAQRQRSWYMLLFQVPGVAERWLSQHGFRNLRECFRHPDHDAVVTRLRDPEALSASLGVYRAILPPESLLAPPTELPPIQAPTMGMWSTGDGFLTEEAMTGTAAFVAGPWRYERIEGAGHWIQLDAPDRVNRLLLDFLSEVSTGVVTG